MIGTAGQDCPSPADVPVKVKQPAGLVPLTSISPKDRSDPHLQMTKTQFLAQLAVSPVVQDTEKASCIDAESSTSDKKRFQKNSILAQLQSHLKTHFQARRADTNPEPHTETHTVSPKRPRLETDAPNDKNTSSELIPVNQTHPGAAEDVTPPGKTTVEPSASSHTRSGLCKDGVKVRTTMHPRKSKSACESTPVPPLRISSGQDDVGSKNKKSMRPNKSSPKKTESTSMSPRRTNSSRDECDTKSGSNPDNTTPSSLRPMKANSSGDGASPKQTRSTSVSPRASGKNGSGPKMSPNEVTPVSTRRCSFTNSFSTEPIRGESDSFSPRRNSKTTDGASTKNTRRGTGSSAVRWPKLAKDGVSPRKTGESSPAKKHRFIQDGTDPKTTLKVLNTQKSVKAVKGKARVKVKSSTQANLRNGAKRSLSAETRAAGRPVKTCTAKGVWAPPRVPASRTAPAGGQRSSISPVKKEARSQNHTLVYPPSVSLHPIPVKAPPIVSPLQPLSVIGRHLLKNQCGECGLVLSSSSALESHVGLHAGLRPFSCTLCGKHFSDSKGLKRHGRVHRNGRIHVCQQCGKGFVYSFGLTKHIQMVHSRIKPFVCQICNKGCFTKQDVEAHIRSHTGEKPFHCNLCDKKFTRRIELNVHLRWHNGEKRHWCPYCGKGFLDFNNLKRHKYIHTGEKPHSCPHCVKNFTQSGHLKKHLKNVHKVQ
ncbi:uncharacterized protein [Pempheris klunzingeri]|uniref:uncharacterized protein n=1 Tax=Pempheris klunzingeri TaxID=3127111 RepID=UPI003980DA99